MSLHQDHFSMLSEMERLAAMALDAVRVRELEADQWPTAIAAAALLAGGDEMRREELARAYDTFTACTPVQARATALVQMTKFISAGKGNGWRGLLPFAERDPHAPLRRKAAVFTATLATPSEAERFNGIAELVSRLQQPETPTTILDALLGLGDMRFLPHLQKLYTQDEETLRRRLGEVEVVLNHAACQWLLGLLQAHPALAAEVSALLVRTAPGTPVFIDLTMPVPSWEFRNAAPQPLHGWTPQEYFARLLPGLQTYLTAEQTADVRRAFSA